MKKLFIIIAIIILPIRIMALTPGDLDGNGKIGSADYILIRKYILGIVTLDSDQKKSADVNYDNTISVQDYIKIRKVILNLDVIATPASTPKQTPTVPLTEEEKICESVKDNASIDYLSFASVRKDNDDYYMIKAAHDCANKYNKPVSVTKGDYNIYKKTTGNIIVKTNTNLNNSNIYIHDESGIVGSQYSDHIYKITGDSYTYTNITAGDIKLGNVIEQLKGSPTGYYARVVDLNSGRKVFIRYGVSANSGSEPSDAFRVDKNGKILDPIVWSYKGMNVRMYYTKIPAETLTFKNAKFYTIADTTTSNTVKSTGILYLQRGIYVNRSNTVVDNVSHAIINSNKKELTWVNHGYYGFFVVSDAANVTLSNLRVYTVRNLNKFVNSTYDIILERSTNLTIKDAKAYDYDGSTAYFKKNDSQMINDYWGMVGSNGTKNVTYDGCVLNRIDAHTGTYNLTIKNSIIGRRTLTLIGYGDLLIDNVDIYANKLIELRSDYGSTWKGNVVIRNSTFHPLNTNITQLSLIELSISYDGNYLHNFGYDLYLPNIKMENFTVDSSVREVYLFGNTLGSTGKVQGNLSKVKNYIKNNEFTYNYPKKSDISITNARNNRGSITIWNYIINFGEN